VSDVIPMFWTPASDAVIVRKYPTPVSRETSGGELRLIPLDGTAPRKLDIDLTAAIAGHLGRIRLSSDGRRLAYVVGKFHQTETWVLENLFDRAARCRRATRGRHRPARPSMQVARLPGGDAYRPGTDSWS
jgi:hypothetical protein